MALSLLLPSAERRTQTPQHRTHNPRRVSHASGLAILRFRSPLLTESQLFSLPTGTEMFHFPALPPQRLYIQCRVTRHHSRRVSPFGHPRIHARLTAPRGITQPPTSFIGSQCQGIHHAPLNTYNTKNQKSFELKNSEIAHQTTKHTPAKPHKREPHQSMPTCCLDARNHYPQIKHHTPPPKRGDNQIPIPGFPQSGRRDSGLVVSKPNSVSDDFLSTGIPDRPDVCCCTRTDTHYRRGPSHESPRSPNPHTCGRGLGLVVLLRKEVIQPHLPVRLPCYDFVPIADPTFDGSLPQGVRPPASGVTDFHDVTGGVYKARERIHRSVADLRLLATPTSRGRVADPDPN